MEQLYFTEHLLNIEGEILIEEKSAQYFLKVIRKKTNDKIFLTNGLGKLARGKIVNDNTKNCIVYIEWVKTFETPRKRYSIAISLLKNVERFEWFLEKSVEFGISEIFPIICDRTEKLGLKMERSKQIIQSAMLQSQQYFLPTIYAPQPFEDVLKKSFHHHLYIAHCCEAYNKQNFYFLPRATETHLFFIGPEGDFSFKEIQIAMEHKCHGIDLGKNRLRTETAGVFISSVVYYSPE